MIRTLLASLLLATAACAQGAAPPTALTAAEMKQAEGSIQRYFEAKDDAGRSAALDELSAIDHPSKNDVGKLAARAFQWSKSGIRLTDKLKQTCTHPDYKGDFEMQVPSGAKKGQPTGVFICLHGGGAGVGDGAQIKSLFGAPGIGLINVWPTVIKKDDSAWNTEREERYVLAILDDLKRSFSVDTNRVYLAGHSMGGYGTWSIGPRHADLFAALSPQAGGVFVGGKDGDGKLIISQGIIPNLLNTPIWFYNSTDDRQVRPDSSIRAAELLDEAKAKYGPFDFVWRKYDDIGHGTAKEGLSEIWKWMLSKKRNPLPKRVLFEATRSYKTEYYWLRSGGGGLADVERDGNTFTVRSGSGLTILLNEKMVKMDQPVVVKDAAGKELAGGKPRLSLVTMLRSIGERRDPEMWFSAEIEVK
ncbi:MAG: hypothetical protein HUU15_12790 [Candidatus Brocadiae bacterium]|nr:hypothetical protein [Candidatus Brocadiia bacterium]